VLAQNGGTIAVDRTGISAVSAGVFSSTVGSRARLIYSRSHVIGRSNFRDAPPLIEGQRTAVRAKVERSENGSPSAAGRSSLYPAPPERGFSLEACPALIGLLNGVPELPGTP
jgi:hypothetical protein